MTVHGGQNGAACWRQNMSSTGVLSSALSHLGLLLLHSCSPFPSLSLQSLIFLGCVAAAGLGLNLLCLAIYLSCLCCCRKDEEEESKKTNSCCVTWSAVAAGLITW